MPASQFKILVQPSYDFTRLDSFAQRAIFGEAFLRRESFEVLWAFTSLGLDIVEVGLEGHSSIS